MTGNEYAGLVLPDYVPPPEPATADRLIGAHYFPGWKPGAYRGWSVLADYPERKPVLGWYDESNPEVTDWEIKWALEHGIGFFVYCWYRDKENAGKRVGVSDVRMGHAIHEGLFGCRYKEQFRFAIMWENYGTRGMIASIEDLDQNLVPFWASEYFSKPFYLRLDGRPVLFVYHLDSLIEQTGGLAGASRAVETIRRRVEREGLGEIMLLCEHRGTSRDFLQKASQCGFDAVFAYCWHADERFPTIAQAFDKQMATMATWKESGVLPFPATATVGWDPMPWSNENPDTPWLHPDKLTRWYSSPAEFRDLLCRIRAFSDSFPVGSLTRSVLLLDNWNEWAEGHFISPHSGGGFGYLQAVRETFTERDNLPDYRTPGMLGLGPYGQMEPAQSGQK